MQEPHFETILPPGIKIKIPINVTAIIKTFLNPIRDRLMSSFLITAQLILLFMVALQPLNQYTGM